MKTKHLIHLVCLDCRSPLEVKSVELGNESEIEKGSLTCPGCRREYPVIKHIPRFVPAENYADSFGLQWNIHYRTQFDSYTGKPVTERRFFNATEWGRDLEGELMLEAGCGSGRFTEQALKTGATLVSFDYSNAVEANYKNNGQHENLLIIQADMRHLPFRPGYFDKVFCFGVIQHTPDPHESFSALPPNLKPGGELAIDVYKRNILGKLFSFTPAPPTKYLVRPITKRMPPRLLYKCISVYIAIMWPLCKLIGLIPKIGRNINWMLLVADHSNLGLDKKTTREWAILNTFDMLAPRYDIPQRLPVVRQWFEEAGLKNIKVEYGYNGIVGRGQA